MDKLEIKYFLRKLDIVANHFPEYEEFKKYIEDLENLEKKEWEKQYDEIADELAEVREGVEQAVSDLKHSKEVEYVIKNLKKLL